MTADQTEAIRALNDQFRTTLMGGRIVATSGVRSLDRIGRLIGEIQRYNSFDENSDSFQEHDFGSIQYDGELIFWKIDYYNGDLTSGSENPSDPTVTARVMTVMLAKEY